MSYTADDIKSLTFREGVRTRIQMYLGSADNEGTYQAFKEIVNNSTDEALCGYGNKIEIGVSEKENTIYVRDYGRGVPFRVNPDGSNVLVDIYTKAHTGGKFDDSVYKNVGGLNGIGGSCVCLSSINFEVKSYRDGLMAYAYLLKGELQTYKEEKTKQPNGTWIKFNPDPEVFKDEKIGYSFERICSDIHDISYLYPGILFTIRNTDTNEERDYQAKNGIIDFIKDNLPTPLHKTIITGSASDGIDSLEIAFQWGRKHETSYVFVNGLRTPEGGSPITGAKTAITKTFNSLANGKFDGEQIRQNLFYVINCKVAAPSFANQTKSKINNVSLRTLASTAFTNALKQMKKTYSNEFDTISEMLKKVQRAEAAAERARAQVLNATKDIEKNQRKKVFASDKLKDAEFLGQDSTLLLVEGNSPASSMAVARDITKYGILALRGKVINCLSNPDEKIYENEEIKLLLSAMNIIPGKYDNRKLRYGRIAITVDADSDGFHIALLIMSALQYLAPEFLREGRLCWLRAPLYMVKNKGKEYYFYSDAEHDASNIKGETARFKGLGSMSAEQAHNSMFSDEFQRMDKLELDENALKYLYDFMGEDVAPRKDYVFNHIDFSTIRE